MTHCQKVLICQKREMDQPLKEDESQNQVTDGLNIDIAFRQARRASAARKASATCQSSASRGEYSAVAELPHASPHCHQQPQPMKVAVVGYNSDYCDQIIQCMGDSQPNVPVTVPLSIRTPFANKSQV